MSARIDSHEITQALDEAAFFLAYQPIVRLGTGKVEGVEALLRWAHPALGVLLPDSFLSLIHGAGLSHRLTQFGIDQVLADLPKLRQLYGDEIAAALNLSQKQLVDPQAMTRIILDALDRTGEDPTSVHIEVVEDSTSRDIRHSASAFAELRASGISIVLDDFGTGASSLTALTEAAYDGLKIDRSFVQGVVTSTTARSVVEAILAFGRSTGTWVVAEGVESSLELQALHDIGCTLGQGHYLGQPEALTARSAVPTFRPLSPTASPTPANSEFSSSQIDEILERTESINPRSSVVSFDETLRQLEALDKEAQLVGQSANRVRCLIGTKVTIAAKYHNDQEVAMLWGMRTSRLAEQVGQWSTSAEMLCVVASSPWEGASNPALPVDALTRALQLRITKPMTIEEGAAVDNGIGAMLANVGLIDHAFQWWKESAERHADSATFGSAMCCLNLIELQLESLEGEADATDTGPTAISVALLEQTLSQLDANPFGPKSVAPSLRCRFELVQGNLAAAEQAAASIDEPLTDIISKSLAFRALAHLARAQGEPAQFLEHTTGLVDLLADRALLSHHDWHAQRLHAQALLANGRTTESVDLSQKLLLAKQSKDQVHLATLFEWIRHTVDLNVRYDELVVDVAARGGT